MTKTQATTASVQVWFEELKCGFFHWLDPERYDDVRDTNDQMTECLKNYRLQLSTYKARMDRASSLTILSWCLTLLVLACCYGHYWSMLTPKSRCGVHRAVMHDDVARAPY